MTPLFSRTRSFAIDGSFDDNLFGIARNEELLALLNVDFADKEITSNPVNLSYGQQQKLALMRLFGTDEPTLFLDEPLSNLDTETQQHLIQYIKSLKGKKTILVIMHSDELDDFADGILWIHDHQMILERPDACLKLQPRGLFPYFCHFQKYSLCYYFC